MDEKKIKEIIVDIKENRLSIAEALSVLKKLPYQDLGYAKVDHHRAIRKGFPEVVYGKMKTPEQIIGIVKSIYEHNKKVLLTKIDSDKYNKIKKYLPVHHYNEKGMVVIVGSIRKKKNSTCVPVLTGGTADIPVAEEAISTIEAMGSKVERVFDVGAAGVHRLLDNMSQLRSSKVIIVVAGMDGVLPTIVSGLVNQPVIAVPASTGYGTSYGGLSALFTMLNSCSPGLLVVNIDNGFGAGYAAAMINSQ